MIYSLTYNPTAEDHDTLTLKGDGAIDFEAASTILIKDNEANALVIKEGVNPYLTLKTTDSSELVSIHKDTRIVGDLKVEGTASGGVNSTSTPVIDLYQNDYPEGDDGDILGKVKFTGHNANGLNPETIEYGSMYAEIIDETPGTEDGSLHFGVQTAGSLAATVLTLNGTVSTLNTPLVINSDYMELVSTQTSSQGEMPVLSLYRNNTTDISDSDDIGSIRFFATNEDNLKCFYAGIYADAIKQDDDGAHQGAIRFHLADGGGGASDFNSVTTSISGDEDPIMSLFKYGLTMSANNDFILGQNGVLTFEGASSNSNETHLFCVDPTNNDNTILLPDASGTIVLKDSTDTLTNKSIAATQLTGTIDNGRLPAAATTITSVGTLSGLTTGATTVNGALTVNNDVMEVVSTDAGATAKPVLKLTRNSSSPADNDVLGAVEFHGENSASADKVYGSMDCVIVDEGTGVSGNYVKGQIRFNVATGAVQNSNELETPAFTIDQTGVYIGNENGTGINDVNYYNLYRGQGLQSFSNSKTYNTKVTFDEPTADRSIKIPDVGGTVVVAGMAGGDINGGGGISSPKTAWSLAEFKANPNVLYTHYNASNSNDLVVAVPFAGVDIATEKYGTRYIFVNTSTAGSEIVIDLDGFTFSGTQYYSTIKYDGGTNAIITSASSNLVVAAGGTIELIPVTGGIFVVTGIGYS